MKRISSPYALEDIPILIAPIVQNQWCTNTTSLRHLSNSSVREVVIRHFSQPRYTFPTKFFFSVPFPFFESTISIKPPTILPSDPDTIFCNPAHLKRPLYLALWLPQVHFTPLPSDGVMAESKFRAAWGVINRCADDLYYAVSFDESLIGKRLFHVRVYPTHILLHQPDRHTH